MNRDELIAEIFAAIYEVGSKQYSKEATADLIKKIDEYVEDAVITARLEVMKNFGAI